MPQIQEHKAEESYFTFSDKWNNFFKKTCGCKSWSNCPNIWRKSKQFVEKKKERKLSKKRSNLLGNSISEFFDVKDPFKVDDV
jgi:hypothetical protein